MVEMDVCTRLHVMLASYDILQCSKIWLLGVGRAIAESISCLLPEMAVATPRILHSNNLWTILREKPCLVLWFRSAFLHSLSSDRVTSNASIL